MKDLTEHQLMELFPSLWGSLKQAFFKLETRQFYCVEDEQVSFEAFQNGNTETAKKLIKQMVYSQQSLYEAAKTNTITMTRVHIVEIPISDYIAYELEIYKFAAELGENIFLLTDQEANAISEFRSIQDFLLFDDRAVIVNIFDDEGRYQHSQQSETIEECEVYIQLKRALMQKARPMEKFLATHEVYRE